MREISIIKKCFVVLIIIWFPSLIIAPYTLPPKTIYLSDEGRAYGIDYGSLWSKLPLYHRIVYTIGDQLCHQKRSRSFFLAGNQMPVCSRCFGAFTGITLAFLPLFIIEQYFRKKYMVFREFLFKKHRLCFILVYITLSLPLIIDFTTQFLNLRTSDNHTRYTTDLLFSIVNTILLYHLLFEESI